jgi:BirA family transcriptional regulator, biotin operon repressor / biotin---[acetyl-CoA-carboxylase] ligase
MTGFKQTIIELDKVNSTNDYASSLLKTREIPEGTVIWAMEQYEGKGLGANTWESEPGKNLTFSMILHPAFLLPENQFCLNEAVSMGVLDFTRSLIPAEKNSLKWPNDIYSGNRKLGGILINNIISGTRFETSIVGIGLNINQTEFPANIPNPISVKQILRKETDLTAALNGICMHIKQRYSQLQDDDPAGLHKEYCKNLLGFESWRMYKAGDQEIEGKITGVDGSGRLSVEFKDGHVREFDHQQIEFLL